MQIMRSFLALLAGFLTMAVVVAVVTAILAKRAPEWVGEPSHPGRAYIWVNLAYSVVAAILGGFVTASIANTSALKHVLILAIVVLLLSGLSALQMRGQQPIWYQIVLMALAPAGILAGGILRLKAF